MTRQIVLEISTPLHERMKARAAEKHYDIEEWVLRAAIRALFPPEFTMDRIALEKAWDARPPIPALRPVLQLVAQPQSPTNERNAPHAPNR